MNEEAIETAFICGGCDYSTTDLKEGMSHTGSTGHELTREVDDEGTTMTISLVLDESDDDDFYDEDDDWNAEDQW